MKELATLAHLKVLNISGYLPGGIMSRNHKPKSSPVALLSISYYMDTSGALSTLLEWPAQLESFSFTFLFSTRVLPYPSFESPIFHDSDYGDSDGSDWTPSNVQCLSDLMPLISSQSEALRSLEINIAEPAYGHDYVYMDYSKFDLTGFSNLEELTLSGWATYGCDASTARAPVAPRLHEFTCVFDDRYLRFHQFGEAHELFVRELVSTAVQRESPLETVHLSLDQSGSLVSTYFWDIMDRISADIKDSGIHLTYPPRSDSWEDEEDEEC
ncbi:hypothetical protein B0T14DRAFT_588491 [Immersiella caudata]|uniref:Uncharacterized protein n=1 Tax=Immersiella caudata TaxID=314043 RepID=A0AA40BWV6_9PEZI|nr:hypothetical protein B0T14DRAFT_588491 [Immersiella caudata]